MTRDDIIRMAKEAHKDLVTLDYPGHAGQLDPWTLRLLERFHALAIPAEREACAKVAESYEPRCDVCPKGVANAIRARGET